VEDTATSKEPGRTSSRIVVVGLGDSITAGNPGYDPDPAKQPFEGDDPESQYLYWAAQRDPRIEFTNHGVGGEVTEEILGRFEAAVAGVEIDVLIVQGGINDIYHGRSIADAARNLEEMVRLGQERGYAVVMVEVLPWNKGWPDAEQPIRALNVLIHEIAARRGVGVLPFHDTLEDPDRPGRMRAEWTSDGDHPSVEGYRKLGEVVARLAD
jgi:lysophospholipase L1-like esterase